MKMREIMSIMEARNPLAGTAYWVSPDGGISEVDEHPEFVRDLQTQIGLDDWQSADDGDANFFAIKKGWTRVIVQGDRLYLSTDTLEHAKKAVKALMRARIANRAMPTNVDFYTGMSDSWETPNCWTFDNTAEVLTQKALTS
jgi:hypothetical protein